LINGRIYYKLKIKFGGNYGGQNISLMINVKLIDSNIGYLDDEMKILFYDEKDILS
jgi:hypothetical protein